MTFPISGVQISPLVPFLVGLAVSLVTSTGGVSGGFLLPPFQISVLGFTSPAVSPTSLVYNIVAIPSGVYRYVREGRMVWPLAWTIVAGTMPGVGIGVILRVEYLPDPKAFKFFAGCVLLYVGGRLLYDLTRRPQKLRRPTAVPRAGLAASGQKAGAPQGPVPRKVLSEEFIVRTVSRSWRRVAYQFHGETFSFSTMRLVPLVLVVGAVSGTYGIGGGAITAPLLVTFFRLPVHTVAGAALLSTFVTSVAGVIFYRLAAVHYAETSLAIAPDWLLGGLFGLGGAVGMYLGARCQRFLPAGAINVVLSVILLFLAVCYVGGFWG